MLFAASETPLGGIVDRFAAQTAKDRLGGGRHMKMRRHGLLRRGRRYKSLTAELAKAAVVRKGVVAMFTMHNGHLGNGIVQLPSTIPRLMRFGKHIALRF